MTRLDERVSAAAQGEILEKILATLQTLPNGLRQSLADRQWESIPLTVDEFAQSDSLAAGATLTVSPQTAGLELITGIVACVPTGATAVVQLGLQKLYLPAGVTPLTTVRKIMQTTDTRAITISGASGPTSLWLSGEQLPTYGVLSR